MNKWQAIVEISDMSDKNGDKLMQLMEKVHAGSLREVSEKDAIDFLNALKAEQAKETNN